MLETLKRGHFHKSDPSFLWAGKFQARVHLGPSRTWYLLHLELTGVGRGGPGCMIPSFNSIPSMGGGIHAERHLILSSSPDVATVKSDSRSESRRKFPVSQNVHSGPVRCSCWFNRSSRIADLPFSHALGSFQSHQEVLDLFHLHLDRLLRFVLEKSGKSKYTCCYRNFPIPFNSPIATFLLFKIRNSMKALVIRDSTYQFISNIRRETRIRR